MVTHVELLQHVCHSQVAPCLLLDAGLPLLCPFQWLNLCSIQENVLHQLSYVVHELESCLCESLQEGVMFQDWVLGHVWETHRCLSRQLLSCITCLNWITLADHPDVRFDEIRDDLLHQPPSCLVGVDVHERADGINARVLRRSLLNRTVRQRFNFITLLACL